MSGPAGQGYEEPSAAGDDPRLLQATQEYLAALEAGRRPSRQEFLARHADIAPQLADCLDGLAFVHSAAGQLAQPGEVADALALEVDPLLQSPLGDYRIVRELGRGGMGIVYEAVQLSLGRRVALKVLPFVVALDGRHLQRFKHEAQAAAQLHHPNIVPVYAVGAERGVHYYAMQLVEGQTVAVLIRQLQQLTGREPAAQTDAATWSASRVNLASPAQAQTTAVSKFAPTEPFGRGPGRDREFFRLTARLGKQAAEALEHAHQLGVVHRDVKPGNLLLDGRGNVWVTDFGLAQFQADGGLTRTGDLLGTLRYMSPEQALGRTAVLDHRTDIYSLGVTLYELLTLRPAFTGQDRQEVLHKIQLEEPPAPRTVDGAIPVELETIVLKALAKEPAERYATAGELADDLQRFLSDRPIRARRPTLWERARKWTRRHRAVTISALVLLLTAVAGSSATALLLARAYEGELRKAEEANAERARAERSFHQARQAVDLLTQVSQEELAGNPHLTELRRKLLETALDYYRAFVAEHQADPRIQAELTAARRRVTAILSELTALQDFGRVKYLTVLLGEPAVQDDLDLSAAVVAEVTGQAEQLRAPPPSARDLREQTPDERRRALQKMTRGTEQVLARMLSSNQLQRLRQIALQRRGADAFRDPQIVAALHLSGPQQDRIRRLQEDLRQSLWGRFRTGKRHDERQTNELRKRNWEQVLAVLTREQQAAWNALVGEPFQGAHYPKRRPAPRPGAGTDRAS